MLKVESVKARLTDFAHSPFGLFSELIIADELFYILEPAINPQNPALSYIPPGIYEVQRLVNTDDIDEWILINVPGHSGVTFSIGNEDTEAFNRLLIGNYLGSTDDKWVLKDSRAALIKFNKIMHGINKFTLYVERVYGTTLAVEY